MVKKSKSNTKLDAAVIWGVTRIALGFIFLWAFLDKMFGLGFATCRDPETSAVATGCAKSVVGGGSPTEGFLSFGTSGPLAETFQGLAGSGFVDFLFMFGLLGLGLALILGIGMKVAAYAGSLLMLLMWAATLPTENNPLVDEHIIYALVLFGLLAVNEDQKLGFGKQWAKTDLVKKYPILK